MTAQILRKRWLQLARFIFNPLIGALIFLSLGALVFFGGYTRNGREIELDGVIKAGFSNLGIELVSIALTVIIVDQLNRQRDERERKQGLILQMGSPSSDFALDAIRQLQNKGWLKDGSLRDADLGFANLQGAYLFKANLKGAYLQRANLQGADLRDAHLQGAKLYEVVLTGANLGCAFLQGADLRDAELQGAKLLDAHLEGANLFDANLQGANLLRANLQGANLSHAKFDETTILPGHSKWTPERDMREFTDPDGWKARKYKPAK